MGSAVCKSVGEYRDGHAEEEVCMCRLCAYLGCVERSSVYVSVWGAADESRADCVGGVRRLVAAAGW